MVDAFFNLLGKELQLETKARHALNALMSNIYSSRVLELASDIHHIGDLVPNGAGPIGQSKKVSKLCGSEIELSLQLDVAREKVVAFAIHPKACALGQASAAVLSQHIIGADVKEVQNARDELRAMLKENGKHPEGRFWELRYLEAVADYPPRHTSTLLAWEAALDAIEKAKTYEI